MPWVKIDDEFYTHAKFRDVSVGGIGAWILGLAYCNRYLTDGHITAKAAAKFGATKKLTAELVDAGLWVAEPGGWRIHDYLIYQPSAAIVARRRDERSRSGKKGAASRWDQDDGSSYGSSHSNGHSPSYGSLDAPYPVSLLVTSPSSSNPVDARADDDDGGQGKGSEPIAPRVLDALTEVGKRHHQRAADAGRINGNPAKHLESCVANARIELLEDALRHWAGHPDATTADLVNHLDPPTLRHPSAHRLALVPGPAPNPTCGHCGGKHTPIPGGCTLPAADPEVDP